MAALIRIVVYRATEECQEAFTFTANLFGPGAAAKGRAITEALPMRFFGATAVLARKRAEDWLDAERARQDKIGRNPNKAKGGEDGEGGV